MKNKKKGDLTDKPYRIVDEKEEKELQNRKAYNAQNAILEKNKQASNHKLLSKLNLYQGNRSKMIESLE